MIFIAAAEASVQHGSELWPRTEPDTAAVFPPRVPESSTQVDLLDEKADPLDREALLPAARQVCNRTAHKSGEVLWIRTGAIR